MSLPPILTEAGSAASQRIRATDCRVVTAETPVTGQNLAVDRLVEAVPEGQRPPDDRADVHALLAEHDGAQHAEQEPNANRTDYVRLHRCLLDRTDPLVFRAG